MKGLLFRFLIAISAILVSVLTSINILNLGIYGPDPFHIIGFERMLPLLNTIAWAMIVLVLISSLLVLVKPIPSTYMVTTDSADPNRPLTRSEPHSGPSGLDTKSLS
jgi:hypothetical protein